MSIILSAMLCAAVAAPVDIQTQDGRTVAGEFVSLSSAKAVVNNGQDLVSLPVEDLESISFRAQGEAPKWEPNAWVELVDGSLLAARDYTVEDEQARFSRASGEPLTISVRDIRSVRFGSARSQNANSSWGQIRHVQTASDRIVIRKKDRLDAVEGVLDNVDKSSVDFRLDDDLISVRRAKVVGLVYYHRRRDQKPVSTVRVTDRQGSEILGTGWVATEAGIMVHLESGIDVPCPFDQIVRIDFALDRTLFLDQMSTTSITWRDFWPQLADKRTASHVARLHGIRTGIGAAGPRPELGGNRLLLWQIQNGIGTAVPYDRGIVLFSRTSVVYRLPDGARYFRARVGIDARTREHGHVRLTVRGDGQLLFEEEVAGGDPPREIVIPLDNVDRFEIVVDYGDNQDAGDWLNLCNARILR